MISVSVDVFGIPEVNSALEGVKVGVRNRVVKGAMRQLASKANKKAKDGLQRHRTKQLHRSLGIKYRSYKKGQIWTFVIGARRGFKARDKDGRNVNPVHYAHLVERGRSAVRPTRKMVLANRAAGIVYGRKVRAVQATPFLAPAFAMIQATASGYLAAEIPRLLALEVARYAAKGKSVYKK